MLNVHRAQPRVPTTEYEAEQLLFAEMKVASRNRKRRARLARAARWLAYMKPSSSRASSDIISMPQGGSKVSATLT